MYHTSTDSRSIRSKEWLFTALASLVQTKSYDSISINELVKKAGVSRSTFYRNYDILDDIFLEKIDLSIVQFQDMLITYNDMYLGLEPFPLYLLKPSLTFWTNEYLLLDRLVTINRLDWLINALIKQGVFSTINSHYLSDLDSVEASYIQKCGISILLTVIIHWILNGRKETPSHLADLLIKYLFMK